MDITDLPRIGETITTARAVELCRHFGLDHLVERIEANPDRYRPWEFDGCSCLIDRLLGIFTGCCWQDITYLCCLPHDLGYAYGRPGDESERERVDAKFRKDLLKVNVPDEIAEAMHTAVEVGGAECLGLPFSWAFAQL